MMMSMQPFHHVLPCHTGHNTAFSQHCLGEGFNLTWDGDFIISSFREFFDKKVAV